MTEHTPEEQERMRVKWTCGVTSIADVDDEWLLGVSIYRSPAFSKGRSFMLSVLVGRRRFHIGRQIVRRRPRRSRGLREEKK